MASDFEQLLSEARELFVQGKTTNEDSAMALRRARKILAILLHSASERKFNKKIRTRNRGRLSR